MFEELLSFIKSTYHNKEDIHLHEPVFFENEKNYTYECIKDSMVSSIGKFVDRFELEVSTYLGAKYAIATVNGTSALHISLILSGVNRGDEVLTQSLTFVGTCNPIIYIGAFPVFIDVDRDTLGLSPSKLNEFLSENCEVRDDGYCWNINTNRIIKSCIPTHVNGFPNRIDEIISICSSYNIRVIEDAAEALGSKYKNNFVGTFGNINAFSFNGNKIITTGGGGMIVTNDETVARKAKHLTTQAKKKHKWEFMHDSIGYNYRLPNINAALGCAQLENINLILKNKKIIADEYRAILEKLNINFVTGIDNTQPNYWLNTIVLNHEKEKEVLLNLSYKKNIFLRPLWVPLHELRMYKNYQKDEMLNTIWLYQHCISLPSSFREY